MNEQLGRLTENLAVALTDRDYKHRYEAMYAHAHELERQLDALRNAMVPAETYRHLLDQFVSLNRLIRLIAEKSGDGCFIQTLSAASEEFFTEVASISPEIATELHAIYYRE